MCEPVDQTVVDAVFYAACILTLAMAFIIASLIAANNKSEQLLKDVHQMLGYHSVKLEQGAKTGNTSLALAALIEDMENQKDIISGHINLPVSRRAVGAM